MDGPREARDAKRLGVDLKLGKLDEQADEVIHSAFARVIDDPSQDLRSIARVWGMQQAIKRQDLYSLRRGTHALAVAISGTEAKWAWGVRQQGGQDLQTCSRAATVLRSIDRPAG